MTWLAALALPLALLAVGLPLARRLAPNDGPGHRATLAFLTGALALYLLQLALFAAGIPWSRPVLCAGLLLLGILLAALARRLPAAPRPPAPAPGWGDLIAVVALLAFALLAATQWIVLPDFIYHWGYKAEHFALARGLDLPWLAKSWNYTLHPDYPNLLPSLYAAVALLGGGFAAPPLLLLSALFFALILASARDTLATRVEPLVHQGAVAFLALLLAAYGTGYRLAGAADWTIALALIAAAPPLLAPPPSWRSDLQLGLAAAFAAATKIEGIPLAAFLILVQAARHLRLGVRPLLRSLAVTAVLPAAIVLPWLLQLRRWHLFQTSNTAPFDPARLRPVAAALLEALNAPELHGLPWLILLLPLPLLRRRTRPLAAVCTAQLLFYLWAYLASNLEPRFYVLSNFARLLFHLLPALLLSALLAAEPSRPSPPAETSATTGGGGKSSEA